MPTLPLYTAPADSDAWHRVASPGGYERWHFDAEDRATDTQVVIDFFDGFVFYPEYLRRYAAYRRWPTRRTPPVPSDYPCASLAIYRGGKELARFTDVYPSSAFTASSQAPQLSIGPNRMARRADRAYELHLEASGCSADLVFTPRLATGGDDHRWALAAPLCDVGGSLRVDAEIIAVSGPGYHDHEYGTRPVWSRTWRWMRGRVLFDERTTAFQTSEPRGPSLPAVSWLAESDAAGTRVMKSPYRTRGVRHTATGLICPEEIRFGDELQLAHPRILGASWFSICATYDALANGRAGMALCELVYPHRLRGMLSGRWAQRAFHRV